MQRITTVTEHLLLLQKESPMATGRFTHLLSELILAAKIISREVNKRVWWISWVSPEKSTCREKRWSSSMSSPTGS